MKITDMVDVVMLEDTKQGDMEKKHHRKWHGDKEI
jgi:hypothetical protein